MKTKTQKLKLNLTLRLVFMLLPILFGIGMAQAASSAECPTLSFADAANYSVGAQPISVKTADFNLDGDLDLAVANAGSDNVSVRLGDGLGGFGDEDIYDTGGEPFSVTTGDFDSDGYPDIATANDDDGTVSILINDRMGGFEDAENFGAGDQPCSITTGDFNSDGKLDLATANFFSDNISVLIGDGAGGFALTGSFGMIEQPFSITTGDFDSDGKLDLATADFAFDNISVLRGDGLGGFTVIGSFDVGEDPLSITTGDFNADGYLDLATANRTDDNVTVLRGNGMGGFAPVGNFAVGDQPVSVTTGYFDLDDNLDLAVANAGSDNVSVLRGDGSGGFAPADNFAASDHPVAITTGDFNLDGKPDIATGNISVLINTTNTAPVAVDDPYSTDEDTALIVLPVVGVIANDTDGENDTLTATLVSNPSNAILFNFNPDGSFSYTPVANFFGTDSFTYRISDDCLASNTATVTIMVNAVNDAPTITAAVGVTRRQAAGISTSSIATVNDIEDVEPALNVTVNGSSSATTNGVMVSNIGVTATGNVTADVQAVCGATTASFTLRVTDNGGISGLFSEATLNVTVTPDNIAPVINLNPAAIALFPPTHQYTNIQVSQLVASVSDNCSSLSVSDVDIEKVTSDEVENAPGNSDGNTVNDIVIAGNCKSVQLRRERDNNRNGRVYTIDLQLNDAAGNGTMVTKKISVPLSQNGNPAIDDGAAYTKISSCP